MIQIVGAKVGESADLFLAELEAINPSPPPPAVAYKGNLIGGGSASSGNTDEAAVYLSAGFEARSKRHRFTLGGKYNYGETDGEITVRNALGRIKYDIFLTEKVYAYAHGLLESDEFQDLNLRSTAGLGLGYQIFDTERTSLFVEGGVSYFNEDFDVAQDNSHASARESAGFTFGIVPERVVLFHLHEFYYSLEESDSYYLWSEQGLRFRLLGNFFANFELDYSYNRQPAPGKKNADTALIASLGWGFAF
jgi:putative salt-induced outer membrane protein YdiY